MGKAPEESEPRVMVGLYDLAVWFMKHTNRFPKNWRVTLGDRIDNTLVDMLCLVHRARVRSDKLDLLHRANEELDILRMLSRLCLEMGCLEGRRREYVARQIDEIGRQIGSWIRHLKMKQ